MASTVFAWMPSYFNRFYGLAPDQAGLKSGLVVLVAGVGGIAWSLVADRASRRIRRARLYIPAAAALLTAGLMSIAFGVLAPGNVQFAFILAGAAMMTATVGPVCAVVVDVVHAGVRATATAILALTQNLLGLALGPLLTGFLSDRYGLPFALSVAPLFCVVAGVVLILAARTYESDLARAGEVAPACADSLKAQAA
jgi:MFS family permease